MKNKERKRYLNKSHVFIAFLVVIFDWILQYWSKELGVGIDNKGISFGVGYFWSEYFRFLLPILLLVIGIVLFKLGKAVNVYLFFLFMGGVGNVFPRLIWGYVWDYMQVPYLGLWINLSDVMISFGALSYILVGDDRDTNSL